MLAWENSGFSVDASVRITLFDHDVPSYFWSLEHVLRCCARPPDAERIRADMRKTPLLRERRAIPETAFWAGEGPGVGNTRFTNRSSVGRCLR